MANQIPKGRLGGMNNQVPRNLGMETLVDIVFVIDGTGSMQNLLDAVKERALNMYSDILAGLAAKNRRVSKMRAKVIIFRDIYVDADAFEESEFFSLPDEAEDFRRFVEHIKATGGGDEPESGLEALYRAMKSKFMDNSRNLKSRQIIIMMTDASAHRLDDMQRQGDDLYPQEMPSSLPELENAWESLDPNAKRLLVMAPNSWPWTMVGNWIQAEYYVSEAGKGISADGFQSVIEFISGSIG